MLIPNDFLRLSIVAKPRKRERVMKKRIWVQDETTVLKKTVETKKTANVTSHSDRWFEFEASKREDASLRKSVSVNIFLWRNMAAWRDTEGSSWTRLNTSSRTWDWWQLWREILRNYYSSKWRWIVMNTNIQNGSKKPFCFSSGVQKWSVLSQSPIRAHEELFTTVEYYYFICIWLAQEK